VEPDNVIETDARHDAGWPHDDGTRLNLRIRGWRLRRSPA
jgi:hypothetical protein